MVNIFSEVEEYARATYKKKFVMLFDNKEVATVSLAVKVPAIEPDESLFVQRFERCVLVDLTLVYGNLIVHSLPECLTNLQFEGYILNVDTKQIDSFGYHSIG